MTISDERCDEIMESVMAAPPTPLSLRNEIMRAAYAVGYADAAQPVAADDAQLITQMRRLAEVRCKQEGESDPTAFSEWQAADRIAALTASQPVAAVPREPTPEMLQAGSYRTDIADQEDAAAQAFLIWRAMHDAFTASPSPATGEKP